MKWLVLLALAGCLHDHYECTTDDDCNLGAAGRCEIDHHCTAYDLTCDTLRRYTAHSGDDTGKCWDGHATIADPCAGGQPPALPDDCTTQVCAALPACCETGWSDACAVEAERTCTIRCDTRIAITATRGASHELWDLHYDGTSWSAASHDVDRKTLVSYLAPAPGGTEPRLSGFALDGAFAVGVGADEVDFTVDPSHDYHDAGSVDLDRDLRDTVVLSSQDTATPPDQLAEVLKLDDGSIREIATTASSRDSWGDYDHDAFPDGVSASGARYFYLDSFDGDDHARVFDDSVSSAFGGDPTATVTGRPAPPPSSRGFDWGDLDGDETVDLVAFGNSIRVHLGETRLGDVPLVNIDCDPPITPTGTCTTAAASFIGAIIPGDSIIAATWPTQAVYRIRVSKGPPAGATIAPIPMSGPDVCPATGCAPIVAIVVRDLDGDHHLDVVAIDGLLRLFVGMAKPDGSIAKLVETTPLIGIATEYSNVRVSVSGAVR